MTQREFAAVSKECKNRNAKINHTLIISFSLIYLFPHKSTALRIYQKYPKHFDQSKDLKSGSDKFF